MAHYNWVGPGKLVERELTRARPPRVETPVEVDLEGASSEREKFLLCTVDGCKKKFPKAMLLARHFNQSHEALKESKDSWREYSEEVWE